MKQEPRAGSTPPLERHGLTDEQLVAMLRTMVMQRTLENRGFQLNRQGKIPFASASEGHEAVQAGAAMAFERGKDILVPVLSRPRTGAGHRRDAVRGAALALCARGRSLRRAAVSAPLRQPAARCSHDQLGDRRAAAACRRRGVRDAVPRRERPRGAHDVRRRRHQRRRVARVAQLRGRPPAADRLSLRE